MGNAKDISIHVFKHFLAISLLEVHSQVTIVRANQPWQSIAFGMTTASCLLSVLQSVSRKDQECMVFWQAPAFSVLAEVICTNQQILKSLVSCHAEEHVHIVQWQASCPLDMARGATSVGIGRTKDLDSLAAREWKIIPCVLVEDLDVLASVCFLLHPVELLKLALGLPQLFIDMLQILSEVRLHNIFWSHQNRF